MPPPPKKPKGQDLSNPTHKPPKIQSSKKSTNQPSAKLSKSSKNKPSHSEPQAPAQAKVKPKGKTAGRNLGQKQAALVVGISNYLSPIDSLPAVASDVQAIGKILKSKDGVFRSGDVTALTERSATREKILASMRETLAGASADQTVFVYLAGHGHVEKGQYYYIAYDTEVDRVAETGVPLARIKALFDASKSHRVFLWLDFCHSGGILVRGRRPPMPDDRFVIERAISVVQGQGKVIVAACSPSQYAYEDQTIGHGLFTDALLRGLRGGAKVNGEVTANSLYDFIDREIGSTRQRPVHSGEMTGRIVLMHFQDRSTAAAKRKVAKPKVGKVVKTSSKSKGLSKSKGTWVMLDRHFFLTQTIRSNRDGSITLVITSTSGDEEVNLVSLRPGPYGGGSTIPFAWNNDAGSVRVKDMESIMDEGRHVWTVNLTPQDGRAWGALSEMSINTGNRMYSADDIARLRVGRILLNDPPEASDRDRSFTTDSYLESYIRGSSGTCEVRASPIRSIFAEHRGDRNWKHYARLQAVYKLKASGTVGHILELTFGAVRSGGLPVRFRGRRDRPGSDKPTLFEISGVCPLG